MKTNYIPLSSAISDYLEDYEFDSELKEDLLYKWATDVLHQINTDEQLVNKVMILDVNEYKEKLPNDFKTICEVSFRLDAEECSPKKKRVEQISQWVQNADDGCELEINVNCPDCHDEDCVDCDKNYVEVEVDKIWELTNPQYHYYSKFARFHTFGKGDNSSAYNDEFKLLKYEGDSTWGKTKHLPECANMTCEDCEETYSLNLPYIETSFRKGEVLVSYLARVTDENGDLMIPDHPIVLEAIGDYIIYKMMRKDYIKTKAMNDFRAYKDSEIVYEQSLKRAKSRLQMPSYKDWTKWLKKNKRMRLDRAYERKLKGGRATSGRPSRKDQYR